MRFELRHQNLVLVSENQLESAKMDLIFGKAVGDNGLIGLADCEFIGPDHRCDKNHISIMKSSDAGGLNALIVMPENEEELKLFDEFFGKAPNYSLIAECRLVDGYGEHYILIKKETNDIQTRTPE